MIIDDVYSAPKTVLNGLKLIRDMEKYDSVSLRKDKD